MLHLSVSTSHPCAELWGAQKTDSRAVRNLSSQRSSVNTPQPKNSAALACAGCVCAFTFSGCLNFFKRLLEEKKQLSRHVIRGQVLLFPTLLAFSLSHQQTWSCQVTFLDKNSSSSAPSTAKSCCVFHRQLRARELLKGF